jgi:hypothetical protein
VSAARPDRGNAMARPGAIRTVKPPHRVGVPNGERRLNRMECRLAAARASGNERCSPRCLQTWVAARSARCRRDGEKASKGTRSRVWSVSAHSGRSHDRPAEAECRGTPQSAHTLLPTELTRELARTLDRHGGARRRTTCGLTDHIVSSSHKDKRSTGRVHLSERGPEQKAGNRDARYGSRIKHLRVLCRAGIGCRANDNAGGDGKPVPVVEVCAAWAAPRSTRPSSRWPPTSSKEPADRFLAQPPRSCCCSQNLL